MNQYQTVSSPPAAASTRRSRTLRRLRVRQPAIAATLMAAMCSLSMVSGASAAKLSGAAGPIATQRPASARAVAEAEIGRLARAAGGEVGVLARNLETGATLSLNDGAPFPMASTFKIAVAGTILAQVDAGRLELQQMVPVDPDLVLSSEGIAETFPFPGVSASVHNLIETMLTHSDNTATNVLTRLAGGPAAVTAWVKSKGIDGMRIDGDTNGIVGRFFGLPAGGEPVEAQLKKLAAADPTLDDQGTKPNPKFDDDPRDSSTPKAMVQLLAKIADGHVLSPASTQVLLGSMERCTTGLKRLRGMLPPGTLVRDKTGTIGGTVNDVGIITLPEGRGRIAIAVFIKKSAKPFEERERVIAQIARSVYDYMLIESAGE
jgi:beta-lactamase class A